MLKLFIDLFPLQLIFCYMFSNSTDDYKDIEPFSQVFMDIVDYSYVKEGIDFNKAITYGKNKGDYYLSKLYKIEDKWFFDVGFEKEIWEKFPLPLLGKHNLENTLAAISIAKELGINEKKFLKIKFVILKFK